MILLPDDLVLDVEGVPTLVLLRREEGRTEGHWAFQSLLFGRTQTQPVSGTHGYSTPKSGPYRIPRPIFRC